MNIQKVAFNPETIEKIENAITDIIKGSCSKVIIDDGLKVYKCTNIIRIDLKIAEGK